jgi:hypothetical protein
MSWLVIWILVSVWWLPAAGPALAASQPPGSTGTGDGGPQIGLAVIDSFPLPPGQVRGLTWLAPERLGVLLAPPDADPQDHGVVVILDGDGQELERQKLGGALVRGLAFDGASFWGCVDEKEGESLLVAVNPDTGVVATFPTSGHRPCGVGWDGSSVWVADRDSGRLDRYDPSTGAVMRSLLAPGFSPCGLACDGRLLWTSDVATGLLYQVQAARGRLLGVVAAEDFAWRGREVYLAAGTDGIWFAAREGGQVYHGIVP